MPLMKQILPACVGRDISSNCQRRRSERRRLCQRRCVKIARELGLSGKLRIGIVTGDDIMPRIDELLGRGIELRNMDTDESLVTVRDRIQSANAYLGA